MRIQREFFPGSSELLLSGISLGCWLLTGTPGCGKSVFSRQFLRQGVVKGEQSLVIVTDQSPEEFAEGTPLQDSKSLLEEKMTLVDGYSIWAGLKPVTKYAASDLTLTGLLLPFKDAVLDLSGFRFVFDSFTPIALISQNLDSSLKFLQIVASAVKRAKGWGFIVLQEGVHPAELVNLMKFVLDGVIELKMEEAAGKLRRFIRVYSMRGAKHRTEWVPMDITDKGIVVGRKK